MLADSDADVDAGSDALAGVFDADAEADALAGVRLRSLRLTQILKRCAWG